jgi:hypothetical protein
VSVQLKVPCLPVPVAAFSTPRIALVHFSRLEEETNARAKKQCTKCGLGFALRQKVQVPEISS